MNNAALGQAFASLSTPLVADAGLRIQVSLRIAAPGIHPVSPGMRVAGRVLPVQHFGSVDIFLEAMSSAEPGDVLVIDNEGRTDEGCIGDLTTLEARASGLAGLIVWGTHRDTPELRAIGLPVFSYGTCAFGPRRLEGRTLEALRCAQFGAFTVSRDDVVFADDDGCLFAPAESADDLIAAARKIFETERNQANAIASGRTLREQLNFDAYLKRRKGDPKYSFRTHLRELGGAIEE